jgi:hypothetical protein
MRPSSSKTSSLESPEADDFLQRSAVFIRFGDARGATYPMGRVNFKRRPRAGHPCLTSRNRPVSTSKMKPRTGTSLAIHGCDRTFSICARVFSSGSLKENMRIGTGVASPVSRATLSFSVLLLWRDCPTVIFALRRLGGLCLCAEWADLCAEMTGRPDAPRRHSQRQDAARLSL